MRVIVLSCVFPPYRGGIGTAAQLSAGILAQAGHEVTVLTPKIAGERGVAKEQMFEVKYLSSWLRWGKGAWLRGLTRHIKGDDLVYLHYPFLGTAEAVAALVKFGRVKRLAIHYHMEIEGKDLLLRSAKLASDLFLPWLIGGAQRVICSSLDYVSEGNLAPFYQRWKGKFKEVAFGVDINKFSPPLHHPPANKLLFVGALDHAHYFKGLELLLEALSKIKRLAWSLDVVGGGELLSYYQARAVDLGVANRVKFWGRVSEAELIKRYREAGVLILPSFNRGEAFGLVLIEAMACGTPVIASALPGVRTLFDGGQEGFYVKPGNKESLRDVLEQWLKLPPPQYLAMRRRARRLAQEKYSLSIFQKNLLTALSL
ncbi:glycosyltransferase family 1 protein [Candidatus Parcubacteria bacterium]|nr:MAG: glycosyltransferase family 1 protein [Candidatus Parcubacteria bacterium]